MNNIEYIKHLTTDTDFGTQLNAYKGNVSKSEGVSDSNDYYPIIFVGGMTFSGFNEEIGEEIFLRSFGSKLKYLYDRITYENFCLP